MLPPIEGPNWFIALAKKFSDSAREQHDARRAIDLVIHAVEYPLPAESGSRNGSICRITGTCTTLMRRCQRKYSGCSPGKFTGSHHAFAVRPPGSHPKNGQTVLSERIPSWGRRKFEVTDVVSEPQPEPGTDWHDNQSLIAGRKCRHA